MVLPLTAPTPPHLAWLDRFNQRCHDRAAVATPSARAQINKALHINANAFVQLLGPRPAGPAPRATACAGAALAPSAVRDRWPAWLMQPLPEGAHATRPRLAVAVQSTLIDLSLRLLVGRWPDAAWAPAPPKDAPRLNGLIHQVAQHGLLVLPERACIGLADRARAHSLGLVAAGLTAAAALCHWTAFGLRVARDVHWALCALPVALCVLAVGLAVDLGLIAWRTHQGTHRAAESYLFAPCRPPVLPKACYHAAVGRAPKPKRPLPGGVLAQPEFLAAQKLRHQTRTLLQLDEAFKGQPLWYLGLFKEHVDVPAYVAHVEAQLLQADTPHTEHLYDSSVRFARIFAPQVEQVGERWLRAPEVAPRDMAPIDGPDNHEYRNRKLWELRHILQLQGPGDDRTAFLSHELQNAIDPKRYVRNHVSSEDAAKRRRALAAFEAKMTALLPKLRSCQVIAEQELELCAKPLLGLLQQQADFFEQVSDCSKELDGQLKRQRKVPDDLDRRGQQLSLFFWQQISGEDEPKSPRRLRLLLHTDKLEAKRAALTQHAVKKTLTENDYRLLEINANALFHLLSTLNKAAKVAYRAR